MLHMRRLHCSDHAHSANVFDVCNMLNNLNVFSVCISKMGKKISVKESDKNVSASDRNSLDSKKVHFREVWRNEYARKEREQAVIGWRLANIIQVGNSASPSFLITTSPAIEST